MVYDANMFSLYTRILYYVILLLNEQTQAPGKIDVTYRWPVTPMSSSPRWWRHILIDLLPDIDDTKMVITWSFRNRFGRMTPHFASARRARCNCTGPKWRKYVFGYRIFMNEFSYEKNSYLHLHCSSYCVSLALVHIGHVGGIWYVV